LTPNFRSKKLVLRPLRAATDLASGKPGDDSRGIAAMDQDRFDRWTRALAAGGSRRRVLRAMAGGALGALLDRHGPDQAVAAEAACTRLGRRCEPGDRCCDGGRRKGGECRCLGRKMRCGDRCVSDRACCTDGRPGCPDGRRCRRGRCVAGDAGCTPDCDGKACGPDGCGGTCGPGCAAGETCDSDRRCVACPPEQTGCGFGYGCVDVETDPMHCGTCGRSCRYAERCVGGECVPPPTGSVPRGERCSADEQCDQAGGPTVCGVQHLACYQAEPCDPSGCLTMCVGVGSANEDGATCAEHCECAADAYCHDGRCRLGEWPEASSGNA